MKYGTYQTAEEIESTTTGAGFRRVPVLSHNREASAAALSDHKAKLNRGQRKQLLHARSYRHVPVEPVIRIEEPVRFARQLTALKLTQLVRRQKKFARAASAAKHILAKMNPIASRLRFSVQTRQDEALAALKQVTAEIKARALACEGRLADNTL